MFDNADKILFAELASRAITSYEKVERNKVILKMAMEIYLSCMLINGKFAQCVDLARSNYDKLNTDA